MRYRPPRIIIVEIIRVGSLRYVWVFIIIIPYFVYHFDKVGDELTLNEARIHLLNVVATVGNWLGALGHWNGAVEAHHDRDEIARVGKEGEGWDREVLWECRAFAEGAVPNTAEDWFEGREAVRKQLAEWGEGKVGAAG